jgi:hypothetical protein
MQRFALSYKCDKPHTPSEFFLEPTGNQEMKNKFETANSQNEKKSSNCKFLVKLPREAMLFARAL